MKFGLGDGRSLFTFEPGRLSHVVVSETASSLDSLQSTRLTVARDDFVHVGVAVGTGSSGCKVQHNLLHADRRERRCPREFRGVHIGLRINEP